MPLAMYNSGANSSLRQVNAIVVFWFSSWDRKDIRGKTSGVQIKLGI